MFPIFEVKLSAMVSEFSRIVSAEDRVRVQRLRLVGRVFKCCASVAYR